MSLTLVVLAAGVGSRYGGFKQMDPVGPSGEFIVDYSIHDAMRAGFDRVVFVIRRDIEKVFKATIGARIGDKIKTEYVFQELLYLPRGHSVPHGRKKPWGTGHAVIVCESIIKGPFGVINADDIYGLQSYEVLARFLREPDGNETNYGMVGFILRNTLSDNGSVARGVCRVDGNNKLESIFEYPEIMRQDGNISCNTLNTGFTGNETVSMNMWGFKPSIFRYLRPEFETFLKASEGNPTVEFLIPHAVSRLMSEGRITVQMLETRSAWLGISYPEDKASVVAKIRRLVMADVYPRRLFGNRY